MRLVKDGKAAFVQDYCNENRNYCKRFGCRGDRLNLASNTARKVGDYS